MPTLTLSNGVEVFAALGGRADLSGDDPVVVLVHGAAMDRTVWQMQTRHLAYHGFRVVAVDLVGHGRTPGEPSEDVEGYAAWLATVIEGIDAGPVHLAGHSLGSFIVLQLAADRPDLVRSLLLVGTAQTMPVHPKLMEAAQANDPLAGQLMSGWAFATDGKIGAHPNPGASMVGGTQALIERADPGVLANDLGASSGYDGAIEAAGRVQAPTTLILGSADRMTPVKGAAPIREALESGGVDVTEIVIDGVGHMMMIEAPSRLREILSHVLNQ